MRILTTISLSLIAATSLMNTCFAQGGSTLWAPASDLVASDRGQLDNQYKHGTIVLSTTMTPSPANIAKSVESHPDVFSSDHQTGADEGEINVGFTYYHHATKDKNAKANNPQFKYDYEVILLTDYTLGAGEQAKVYAIAGAYGTGGKQQPPAWKAGCSNDDHYSLPLAIGPVSVTIATVYDDHDNYQRSNTNPTPYTERDPAYSVTIGPQSNMPYLIPLHCDVSVDTSAGLWSDSNSFAAIWAKTLRFGAGQFNAKSMVTWVAP